MSNPIWNVYRFFEDGKLEVMASRKGIAFFKPGCNAVLLFCGLTKDKARAIEDSLASILELSV
jgi:hypothetical protein